MSEEIEQIEQVENSNEVESSSSKKSSSKQMDLGGLEFFYESNKKLSLMVVVLY